MRLSAKHVNEMMKREAMALYSQASQRFRIEWITESGGTLNVPHNVNVGATKNEAFQRTRTFNQFGTLVAEEMGTLPIELRQSRHLWFRSAG